MVCYFNETVQLFDGNFAGELQRKSWDFIRKVTTARNRLSIPINRSVCKTWRRIIDNSTFVKQHIHRGIGGHWFFYRHNKGQISLLPIEELISKGSSFTHVTDVKTLVGNVPRMPDFPLSSCNGLILLPSCKYNFVWRIWNPFTGESLELGQCNEFPDPSGQYFDRPYSGIGYDEANDEYKVVRIVRSTTYLYTVNSKLWCKIGDFPDSHIGHNNGVCAYGALHWIAYSRQENEDLGWIVALDVSTESYRKIVLPSELTQDAQHCLELNALSGCLFLSCSEFKGQHFVAWMIKSYGCEDNWIKMVSLESENRITPLAYLKSKGRMLLHCDEWEYLWYDVEGSSDEMLRIEVYADGSNENSKWYEYTSQVFNASLVRLNKTDARDENVASQGTSRRKRKRNIATTERLHLKLFFGDPEDFSSDDASASS